MLYGGFLVKYTLNRCDNANLSCLHRNVSFHDPFPDNYPLPASPPSPSPRPSPSTPTQKPSLLSPSPLPPKLRPPPHPPITLHHLPTLFLAQRPRILKPTHPLKAGPIQREVAIPEQLLFHKRADGPGADDALCGEEISPGLEDFLVDVVDDAVEVEAGKGGDERVLEAGGEGGESGAEEAGERALRCVVGLASAPLSREDHGQ